MGVKSESNRGVREITMKLITVESKRLVENKKYYKQVYNLNITEKYEQDIIGLLNTATIWNPQELFKLLHDKYESRLISMSKKKA
jgi:cytidylate kinase